MRAVYDVRAALPDLPIVGVGGISSGWDAAEMMLAGANAVQVGTASFANPRATSVVARELNEWARQHGYAGLSSITERRTSAWLNSNLVEAPHLRRVGALVWATWVLLRS